MEGYIHSYQTLGGADGPGVRFVVFMQGCPLRCIYCHNPDTWEFGKGFKADPKEVFEKIKRYTSYFGDRGGVTISGGEPLAQGRFVKELLKLCRENEINTAIDTSGTIIDEHTEEILENLDVCLLDIKFCDNEIYEKHTGASLSRVLEFLDFLDKRGIDTWIRQVIVPGINDSREDMDLLCSLVKGKNCVKKIELLPFRKLCVEKYEEMGVEFPLKDTPEASGKMIVELQRYVDGGIMSSAVK